MAGQYIDAMPTPAVPTRLVQPLRGISLCEICRTWADGALCADCVARFAPARIRCRHCGLGLGAAAAAGSACPACRQSPPAYARSACAVDYGFPWDGLIAALKFQEQTALARALAPLLARAVRSLGGAPVDLVLPIPLSSERLRQRGYNQAWELARHTAGQLRLPARSGLLTRPVATAAQHALDRASRQRNLRDAFMVEPGARPALQGRRLALVDDVMTTGATVHEAADTLLRAGAAAVDVWVFARTPEH
jgi:ComF family protein